MFYTDKIKKAIKFATKTHEVYQQQKRKGKDIPYITHPLTVGLIVARAGASENVIVAGILHDTIEDSVVGKKVTAEMLAERFGEKVAVLVESVTEMRKDLPWEERKQEALAHIETFSNESILLKSADIISNLSELLDDYEQEGESIWARFNAPKEKMLENAYKVISAIRRRWPENPLGEDIGNIMQGLVNIETRHPEGSREDFFIGQGIERKLVRNLSESEAREYKELGTGGSPLSVTLFMAFKHTANFFDRVIGYRVSDQGIGRMAHEKMKEMLPNHPQAKPGMGYTYIFYEKA